MITKGPNVIPAAKLAIKKLIEHDVSFVFVSNTCMFEAEKAAQLSSMLDAPVSRSHKAKASLN